MADSKVIQAGLTAETTAGDAHKPELAPVVRSTLAALRRRIRRYVWLHGLAAAVAWLGIAFWISLAIDWTFEPPAAVRGVVLGIAGLVLAWLLFRLILRRAFARLSNRSMAMLLERHFPQFDESLLTAVELTERPGELGPYSRRMLAQTCRRAAEPIRGVRLQRIFNPMPLRSSLLAAALLAASTAGFGLLAPEALGVWTRRSLLLHEELWPRKTRLLVEGFEDGTVKVARGADLEIIAKADLGMPVVPSVVEVRYRTEGGARLRAAMSRLGTADRSRDEFQEYSHTFTGVLTPIRFDVVGGDVAVRDLRIEVVDAPTIVEMLLDCRLPNYMDRPLRTLPVTGVVQLPVGTQITVRAKANKDLVKVQVDDGEALQVHLPEPLRLLENVLEAQDRIREQTKIGGDCRRLAGRQRDLAADLRALAASAEDRVADAVEQPAAGENQDLSQGQDSKPAPLEAAQERMQEAAASLREGNRADAGQLQEEAVRQLREARPQLEAVCRFRAFEHTIANFTRDTTLSFALLDTDHIKSRGPLRLGLAAVADQPPQLSVQLRGIGSAITAEARLPAAGRITDDYGIAKVWFDYAIDQKQQGDRPIESPPGNATEFRLEQALEVGELSLKPGQKLLVCVKAADRYDLAEQPNVGTSERWLLDVVTPEQLRTILEARELVLRQRFERIMQEVTETRDSLLRMEFDAASAGTDSKGPADEQDETGGEGAEPEDEAEPEAETSPDRLSDLRTLRVQRAVQNGRKNAHETLGVAEAFDDICRQLINNRIDIPELKTRLRSGIADPLRDVAERMFPELERRLERLEATLADDAGPEDRTLAVEQVDAILKAMQAVLERMLELEDFNKAVDLLREIIREQEKLSEQTRQRHRQKLRELLED